MSSVRGVVVRLAGPLGSFSFRLGIVGIGKSTNTRGNEGSGDDFLFRQCFVSLFPTPLRVCKVCVSLLILCLQIARVNSFMRPNLHHGHANVALEWILLCRRASGRYLQEDQERQHSFQGVMHPQILEPTPSLPFTAA